MIVLTIASPIPARQDVREIRPNLEVPAPPAPPAVAAPATAETNVALVNAPALWDLGYRGQGIVVANMDTGVDVTHPDLASRWRGGTDSWYDPNGEHPATPTDVSGHGTWTTGVMVGGDAGGSSVGIAPDATWIAVKIFNDQGTATSTGIHQGFQWLLDPDGNPATADAPDVVNNSWATQDSGCLPDFQPDLASLRAAGILPVFAAGNYGPLPGTSASPANDPEAFAVGATDNADGLYPYSSRGPSPCGQPVYPQLAAPGVDIHTTDLYGLYADPTGTSVAAPHAAGVLALLLQAFPGLPADRQAAALENGAVDLGAAGADNDYGYGRLDALAAYQWLAAPPDFGLSATPASGNVVAGASATYTIGVASLNGFTGDVALSLEGLPSGVGAASFSPQVIAGAGSAQLAVTTLPAAPGGTYPLTITGTAGSITHTVAVTLVLSARDFALSVSSSSVTIQRGKSANYTVAVSVTGGSAGKVSLTVAGLPAGTTAIFAPNPARSPGRATLTVKTKPWTRRGTYTLRVTGTSGSLVHEATATLTIRRRPAPVG